ncbi:hypothetical protein GCM10027344_16620 [Spelaeicoccus albus]
MLRFSVNAFLRPILSARRPRIKAPRKVPKNKAVGALVARWDSPNEDKNVDEMGPIEYSMYASQNVPSEIRNIVIDKYRE